MMDFNQGDIVNIEGFGRNTFVIISKNAFVKALKSFHVSPMLPNVPLGPLHISVKGKNGTKGTVICEQIKYIDPDSRAVKRVDALKYEDIMNISDAIQGIFEYD